MTHQEMKKELVIMIERVFKNFIKEMEDECNLLGGLNDTDKLELELLKQSAISGLLEDVKEYNGCKFVYDNIKLYEDLFKATLNGDKLEVKRISIILIKIKNYLDLQ